jgi:hypothetical protein
VAWMSYTLSQLMLRPEPRLRDDVKLLNGAF